MYPIVQIRFNAYKFSTGVLILLMHFFCNCNSQGKIVASYKINSAFPELDTIINNKWTVREYKPTFTEIYYYGDQILIKHSLYISQIQAINNEVVNQTPEKISYYLLIFSNRHGKGVLIDSSNLLTARIVDKDSILNDISVLNDIPKEMFLSTRYQLLSSVRRSNGDLMEEFSFVSKTDSNFSGILKFRFLKKRNKKEKFQISPSMETNRNMRLVEFTIVSSERLGGEGKVGTDRFELPYRLENIELKNEQAIIDIFKFGKKKLDSF